MRAQYANSQFENQSQARQSNNQDCSTASPFQEVNDKLKALGVESQSDGQEKSHHAHPINLPNTVYIWPSNQLAWQAWCGVYTQWRIGFNGPVGLDYAAVRAYLLDLVPKRRKRMDVWHCLQICEAEQLQIYANALLERKNQEDNALEL